MPVKKFPTIIGIILTLLVLGISVLLVQLRTRFFSQATASLTPKNILITNLKPTQFSISFYTDSLSTGFVTYGTSLSMGNIAFDKRDRTGNQGKYNYHYFTLSGLESGKKIYFKIGVNSAMYGGQFAVSQNCQDYLDGITESDVFSLIMPGGSTNITARTIPISGSALTASATPAAGAVVCLQFNNILPISDITSSSGSFIIPLNSLVNKDNTILNQIPPQTSESLIVFGPNREITSGKVLSENDHPIAPFTIGQLFDYVKNVPTIQPTLAPTSPVAISTQTAPAVSKTPQATPTPIVELTSPEGSISDTLPTFRGKGKPGQVLDITVHSDQNLSATVKVDENGFWTWTPPTNLSPGAHTVTIKTINTNGIASTITKSFQVLAANPILPVSAGTPSASISTPTPTRKLISQQTVSPTLKPSPTSIPTAIPTAVRQATPTIRPTITPFPTLTPTIYIAPTAFIPPTTIPAQVPVAGNEFPYYLVFGAGVLSLLCGLIIIYKRIET